MRDENGFKCHVQSESHVRQMLLVGEDPKKFIQDYSNQFQRDFLLLLRTSHGEKKVNINHFYQEYIANKEHVHMNATRWPSLTEFAKYLGREGICRVEETEKGWMVSWIDNSPEALRRQDAIRKKERQDKGDEEREQRMIKEQVERARLDARGKGEDDGEDVEDDEAEEKTRLQRHEGERIKLNLQMGRVVKKEEEEQGEREGGRVIPKVEVKVEGDLEDDKTIIKHEESPISAESSTSATIPTPPTTINKSTIFSATSSSSNKPSTAGSDRNPTPSGPVKKNVFATAMKKKPNPLKQSSAIINGSGSGSGAGAAANGSRDEPRNNSMKRPMSQAEKIMREEIEARERKRARCGGGSTGGNGGGGGGSGRGNPNRVPIGNARR